MIAYRGTKFVIEWYHDEKGHSQAFEYAESLSDGDKAKLAALLMLMGDHGKIRNIQKFRYEGDQIYAFKPQPHRFLCFFYRDQKIIITNAFYKAQDKLPKKEKRQAMERKNLYEQRVKRGEYYE